MRVEMNVVVIYEGPADELDALSGRLIDVIDSAYWEGRLTEGLRSKATGGPCIVTRESLEDDNWT